MNQLVQDLFNKTKEFGLTRILLATRNTYPSPIHPAFDETIDSIIEAWDKASLSGLSDQLNHEDDPDALDTFHCIASIARQAAALILEAHPTLDPDKAVTDMTVVTASIAAHYDSHLHTAVDDYITASIAKEQ